MSYKPEFLIGGVWYDNAIRFATEEEAKRNARAEFAVWTMPTDCRTAPSEDAPNYTLDAQGQLTELPKAERSEPTP